MNIQNLYHAEVKTKKSFLKLYVYEKVRLLKLHVQIF